MLTILFNFQLLSKMLPNVTKMLPHNYHPLCHLQQKVTFLPLLEIYIPQCLTFKKKQPSSLLMSPDSRYSTFLSALITLNHTLSSSPLLIFTQCVPIASSSGLHYIKSHLHTFTPSHLRYSSCSVFSLTHLIFNLPFSIFNYLHPVKLSIHN